MKHRNMVPIVVAKLMPLFNAVQTEQVWSNLYYGKGSKKAHCDQYNDKAAALESQIVMIDFLPLCCTVIYKEVTSPDSAVTEGNFVFIVISKEFNSA